MYDFWQIFSQNIKPCRYCPNLAHFYAGYSFFIWVEIKCWFWKIEELWLKLTLSSIHNEHEVMDLQMLDFKSKPK